MGNTVVVIGLGQLGRVFAGGLLRAGHPVVPVNRGDDLARAAELNPMPEAVVVAVAEGDLASLLEGMPERWRDRLVLLQNELLPRDWRPFTAATPTVISVWFEKKKGVDAKPILPSPVFGPAAALVCGALGAVELPCRILETELELLFELVRKNLYILTSNIAGLRTGGTVGMLWKSHRELAEAVADEVLAIQSWLTGETLERERLLAGMVEAFDADPAHLCTGRSAPARLARALAFADEAGLNVPTLRGIRSHLP